MRHQTKNTPVPDDAYARQLVFINVPFDDDYAPLLNAILFAVQGCGFIPCCALDKSGSGEPRIAKILSMAQQAALSIHDLSRVGLDRSTGYPRFNMPFELGICLAYRHVSTLLPSGHDNILPKIALPRPSGKFHHWSEQLDSYERNCLVFDKSKYRYHKFISDLSGNDIVAHNNTPKRVIFAVRDFLRNYPESRPVSGKKLYQQFQQFRKFSEFSKKSNKTKLGYIEIAEIMAVFFKSLPAVHKPRRQ